MNPELTGGNDEVIYSNQAEDCPHSLSSLGVCVSSAGYTCHPKKKPKIVTHDVVLYNINGSQVGSRQAAACIQLFKFCKR